MTGPLKPETTEASARPRATSPTHFDFMLFDYWLVTAQRFDGEPWQSPASELTRKLFV